MKNGTLIEVRKKFTKFSLESLGEYVFAKIFLEDMCNDHSTEEIIKLFVGELLDQDVPYGYKVFINSSLRYFISMRSDDELGEIMSNKVFQALAREAISQRCGITFNDTYMKDEFLISMMLMNPSNYERIFEIIVKSENIYLERFPLNLLAIKEPSRMKDFIEFTLEKSFVMQDLNRRNVYILLFNSLLILIMRKGFSASLHNMIEKYYKPLLEANSHDYLTDLVVNVLEENYKFLLYGSTGSFLNEIEYFSKKEKMVHAIKYGVFSLEIKDLSILIDQSMTSWLFMCYLFFRDMENKESLKKLQELFQTGEIRYQDFVLTVLGHYSKKDTSFLEELEKLSTQLKTSNSISFNCQSIGNDNPSTSQYDPMVPLISTKLYLNKEKKVDAELIREIFEFEQSPNHNDLLNYRRLLYKTALDFPSFTIGAIFHYKLLETDLTNDFEKILNTIRYTYPHSFWEFTTNYDISLLYSGNEDIHAVHKRSVLEIHDWNWFNVLNTLCGDDIIKENIDNLLVQLVSR